MKRRGLWNLKWAGVCLWIFSPGYAQINVSGSVTEKNGAALPGATIKVLKKDSSFVSGSTSGLDGSFTLSLPPNQNYFFQFSFLSYRNRYKNVELGNQPLMLGNITMRESAQNLSEVEVKTTQIRGEQKEDTTAFRADAFKTNPDATAEDLVKKMPGVTSDNNGIKVNGESVQKILVDGKPFFGDDPSATLKNLPADIIDKVEVFDKMSDQAQFTGFNDGDQQKTINIVTKKGKNTGQFGRIYGGYGTDERYNAGAVINSFDTKRRLTLLLLSNNINQQNFSVSDITGAMGNSGQNQGRGSTQRTAGNLLTGTQNGNTATQSAGLNYSDTWSKKVTVSGSYFFNYTDNENKSGTVRNYFTGNNLVYTENSETGNTNQNHRINFRFEYAIDSANKLTITPALSLQNNNSGSLLLGSNSVFDNVALSRSDARSNANNLGYDFSTGVLFQHKFQKNGRTVSLNLNTQLSERNNDGDYYSENIYGDTTSTTLNQLFKTYGYTKKISTNLAYTEPLSRYSQLQVNYIPSYTEGKSDKQTKNYDPTSFAYDDFNTSLSNKYNNTYVTQRAGLSYKYRKNKLNLGFGTDAQTSSLKGEQTFPVTFKLDQSFQNILPNAQLNYKFSKTKNLRIYYRTNTNIPTIMQLQNVIDISNPLQIKSGNASLKQTFENTINFRFGGFNPETSRNTMLFINTNYTDNYISNATYIIKNDSVIQGFEVKAGSQLTKPVNLNGYYMVRGFFVYGFPVPSIKSNLNINGGVTLNHTPTMINDVLNHSNNYATNGGIYIGSNISPQLDFSIGYNGNYTVVKNTVQKQSDNNYFSHTGTLRVNWILLKRFVINSEVSHTLYNGLNQSFNQEYLLWNAYIGYKFLKDRSLEAKVSVFDLLNQNRSVGRNITGNYTEDYNTVVLKRYLLFTLTYTLKKFKDDSTFKTDEPANVFPGRPYPGTHQPSSGPN